MAISRFPAKLQRRRLWVAFGVILALAVAASRVATIGIVPPSIKSKPIAHAIGSTQLVVGRTSSLAYTRPDVYARNLGPRASSLADMAASPLVRTYIARAAGLPASQIAVDPPLWSELQRIQQWATGEKRASQIIAEKDPYRITLNTDPNAPIINVIAQAPTAAGSKRLAQGVVDGLSAYVSSIEAASGTPLARRIGVSQLAPVTVDPPHRTGLANIFLFTFVAVFVLWRGLVLLVATLAGDVRTIAKRPKVRDSQDRSSISTTGWSHRTGIRPRHG